MTSRKKVVRYAANWLCFGRTRPALERLKCCVFSVSAMSALYAKMVETQQQVLHLTKLVQKSLQKSCRQGDIGSYTMPQELSLPLRTQRAVTDIERMLQDDTTGTSSQLVVSVLVSAMPRHDKIYKHYDAHTSAFVLQL